MISLRFAELPGGKGDTYSLGSTVGGVHTSNVRLNEYTTAATRAKNHTLVLLERVKYNGNNLVTISA
jgi:hypothetical protein